MLFSVLAAAAVAGSTLAAPVHVARKEAPSGWATGYLEDYNTYHVRYLALDCQDQHNTTFFEDCCHPLLASESLDSRPSYCTANSTALASASARVANETATSTASIATATASDDSDDADDSWCSATSSVYESVSETATASIDTTSYSSAAAEATATSTSVADAQNAYAHQSSSSSTEAEYTATSTSSSAAAASSTSSSSGTVYTDAYATFYSQDGVAGECGTVHSDSDYVIAIDAAGFWPDYETNDNSPYCGKSITVQRVSNGAQVTAIVADVCPTCDTNNSLDLSIGAFTQIATEEEGEVAIEWWFND